MLAVDVAVVFAAKADVEFVECQGSPVHSVTHTTGLLDHKEAL